MPLLVRLLAWASSVCLRLLRVDINVFARNLLFVFIAGGFVHPLGPTRSARALTRPDSRRSSSTACFSSSSSSIPWGKSATTCNLVYCASGKYSTLTSFHNKFGFIEKSVLQSRFNQPNFYSEISTINVQEEKGAISFYQGQPIWKESNESMKQTKTKEKGAVNENAAWLQLTSSFSFFCWSSSRRSQLATRDSDRLAADVSQVLVIVWPVTSWRPQQQPQKMIEGRKENVEIVSIWQRSVFLCRACLIHEATSLDKGWLLDGDFHFLLELLKFYAQ